MITHRFPWVRSTAASSASRSGSRSSGGILPNVSGTGTPLASSPHPAISLTYGAQYPGQNPGRSRRLIAASDFLLPRPPEHAAVRVDPLGQDGGARVPHVEVRQPAVGRTQIGLVTAGDHLGREFLQIRSPGVAADGVAGWRGHGAS